MKWWENTSVQFLMLLGALASIIALVIYFIDAGVDNAETHFRLGNEYLKQEKYELAIVSYEKSIRENPNNAEAQHKLGLAYFNQHKFNLAVSSYNKAIILCIARNCAFG